jgi:hypothetical protein
MASATLEPTAEYEFSESQNQLIGSLARKMRLVGFVMLLFGLLQLINGVLTLVMSRDPDRMIAAARQAGMAEEQVAALREAMAGGFWSSPLAVTATAMAFSGLFLFLIGLWTQQAGGGFSGIVQTRGRDIARLMDALQAQHRAYALMYTILMVAAILAVVSLAVTLWQSWGGGA